MSRRLQNYLKTYRKRTGFSQDEIAFLLGRKSGTKVSRYERMTRLPNLQTVFAYEVIFSTPARELFAGMFEEVRLKTLKRKRVLMRKIASAKPTRITARKLEALDAAGNLKRRLDKV